MSIPENQEPKVLSQALELQHLSCEFSGVIPIKKRRFPIISPEEKPSSSENDDILKNEEEPDVPERCISIGDTGDTNKEYNIPVLGMALSAVNEIDSSRKLDATACAAKETDSYGELDVSTGVDLAVKQELVTNTLVEWTQVNSDTSPIVRLGPVDDNKIKQNVVLSNEREVPGIALGASVVNVKQENICEKTEGNCLLKLCTGPKNGEILSGEGEPSLTTPEHNNRELFFPVLNKIELPYLGLSLKEDKLSDMSGISYQQGSNRSNWDLNTTMDVWGGTVCESRIDDKLSGKGGSTTANNSHYVTSTFSAAAIVGCTLNKGKQVVSDYSCNTSVQPNYKHKPDDNLGLTLATFGSDGKMSSSSVYMDFSNVGPNLYCGGEKLSTLNVKPEPDCRIANSSNIVFPKLCPIKREVVENLLSEVVISTANSQPKSYDHKSIKSELVPEDNKDTCKSMDAILPQSARKIMQHQESSASSSVLSIPSISQNSFPLEFLKSLESPIIGSISTQSEPFLSCIKSHNSRNIQSEGHGAMIVKSVEQNDKQLRVFNTEDLNVCDDGNSKPVLGDDLSHEFCRDMAATNMVKMNVSAKMFRDDSFEFDCESYRNLSAVTCADVVDKIHVKECKESKNDERLEQLEHSIGEDATEAEKTENVRFVECDMNVNFSNFLVDQNKNTTDSDGNSAKMENDHVISSEQVKERDMNLNAIKYEDISLSIPLSDQGPEIRTVDDKPISVITCKDLDLSEKNSEMHDDKEVSTATNDSQGLGITLECDAYEKDVEGIWPGKHEPRVSKEDTLINTSDSLQDPNRMGIRKRIINLRRGSLPSTPIKMRSASSKFLTTRTGNEICNDFDKEFPQGNRDVHYTDGPNNFFRDRVHGQPFRKSRPGYMRGKGRLPFYKDWRYDREHSLESSNGKIDYQGVVDNHTSLISDELKCYEYGTKPDGISFGRGKRKMMNDEWPLFSRPPFRRFSPGDKSRLFRGSDVPRICHRNVSPNRWAAEDDSEFVRPLRCDRFMQCLSDDIYDEVDDQHARGNENFSNVRKKICNRSKSPVRSRTRSPGPWPSSHHRSVHEISGLSENRSSFLYRMGRMRSPDRACHQDKLFPRRHISTNFINRHRYDLRDIDSEREHSYSGAGNSNRRIPLGHTFQKRSHDDEYSEGPIRSNKFQELGSDEGKDERRNFRKRNGYIRPFLPNSTPDVENYHLDRDGARPYRFSGYRNRVFEQKQAS